MDQNKFWEIIDQTRDNKIDKQIAGIKTQLIKLDTTSIIEFERILRRNIINADHFHIIASQKIIDGSVSDDSFLYFRCWLIMLGKNVYHNAIENPEYLVDYVEKDANTWGEELLYVTTEAYCEKTNKSFDDEDDDFPREICFDEGLDYDFAPPPTRGDISTMDSLEVRFPLLWRKFNN